VPEQKTENEQKSAEVVESDVKQTAPAKDSREEEKE
jgi:hypothetical protein